MKKFLRLIYFLSRDNSFKKTGDLDRNIFFRSFQKRFIIFFLICFLYGVGFSVSAEDTEEINSIDLYFKGIGSPKSPVKIKLDGFAGYKVDMSAVISALERVKRSSYDNFFYLENVTFHKVSSKIDSLCSNAPVSFVCELKAKGELREALDKIHQDLKDKILYPNNYKKIARFQNNLLIEKVIGILDSDSDCLNKCEDVSLIRAIRSLSEEAYPQLYDKIKTKDKKCQRDMLNALVTQLRQERIPKKCLEEKHRTHPVCETMTKDMKILQGRILEMSKLAYASDVFKTTKAQALCVGCANQVNRVDEEFGNLLKSIHKHSQCSKLKPGQEKRIHSNTRKANNKSYTVKRDSDGTYSIPLNLRFSADDDYDGDVPRDEVPAHYMKVVQDCMKKASTKMLGPNGEKLKIIVQEPTNNLCREDIKNIKVGSKDHRSYVNKYRSEIDCPTITHEVLHLLGLCDEYESEKYTCRVITKNSIMASHSERWENVFDRGKNKSLLTSGQFNAILYGSCDEKNQLFNQCAQLAYEMPRENFNCINRKRECAVQTINSSKR